MWEIKHEEAGFVSRMEESVGQERPLQHGKPCSEFSPVEGQLAMILVFSPRVIHVNSRPKTVRLKRVLEKSLRWQLVTEATGE